MADDVKIVIGAQDKASAVINDVAKTVSGLGGKLSTSFAALGPVAIGAVASIASIGTAVYAVNAAINTLDESRKQIDELAKSAKNIGSTVADLQAFTFAMGEVGGVDADKARKTLQELQKAVGEAAGGEKGKLSVFEKLNLDAKALSLLGPVAQFEAVRKAISAVENGSERAALAQKILGGEAKDVMGVVTSQAGAFEASMQAAIDLNATISDSGAAGVESMNDAIGRVQASVTGLAMQFTVELAPAIELAAEQILSILQPMASISVEYLPAMVEDLAIVVGYSSDLFDIWKKLNDGWTIDVGIWREINFEFQGAQKNLEALDQKRRRNAQAAIDALVAARNVKQENNEVDEAAVKAQEAAAAAAGKTIAALERQLEVSQLGEEAVRRQEQLAQATNDAERQRIALLQEQVKVQEQQNQIVKDLAKAETELAKAKEDEQKKQAEEQQRQAQAIANVQPGVTATQSRLLTRGPAERGIDKVAVNTAKTNDKIDELKDRIAELMSEQTRITFEYGV